MVKNGYMWLYMVVDSYIDGVNGWVVIDGVIHGSIIVRGV